MTPRIVEAPELRLAGIRRRHARAKMAAESRRQWMDVVALGPIPGQTALAGYGVHCEASDAQFFDYLAAVEVSGFETLPATLDRTTLSAGRYAVFEHEGRVADMRAIREQIVAKGLSAMGLEAADRPAFERFDERFDPITATGRIEMWFPVAG